MRRSLRLTGAALLAGAWLAGCEGGSVPTGVSRDGAAPASPAAPETPVAPPAPAAPPSAPAPTTPPAPETPPAPATPPTSTPAPVIGLSPSYLTFVVYAFRPYQPPAQALRITNLGGGRLNWTASDNGSWLTIGPTTGTAPASVMVQVHRASIPIGINGYRPRNLLASIVVSAPGASNSGVTVPVGVIVSYQR
jgi:Viral BACON domain